jgi:hypothetical protein
MTFTVAATLSYLTHALLSQGMVCCLVNLELYPGRGEVRSSWLTPVKYSSAIFFCKGLNYRDTHCLTSSIYLGFSPILFLQPFERFQALPFTISPTPFPCTPPPISVTRLLYLDLNIALAGALACSNPDCDHSCHYSLGAPHCHRLLSSFPA